MLDFDISAQIQAVRATFADERHAGDDGGLLPGPDQAGRPEPLAAYAAEVSALPGVAVVSTPVGTFAQGRLAELRTGDLARQADDGLYEVVGRCSRIAKLFGLSAYPSMTLGPV